MIIGNNDKISVEGSIISIAAFACVLGGVVAQSIDLSAYQGRTVRIYLDSLLQVRVNPKEDMYWQLAEMHLPTPQYVQVQQGTIPVETITSEMITRSESDLDEIPALGDREIISVGQISQNYREGVEWQAEETGVRWIAERSPVPGETYPIELSQTTEEPRMVAQPVPLDLNEIEIQVFEKPA